MINDRREIQSFIARLYGSSEIVINGVLASSEDLAVLCERVSKGKTNICQQKQYIIAGQIKKICISTTD